MAAFPDKNLPTNTRYKQWPYDIQMKPNPKFIGRPPIRRNEHTLQLAVADYIRLQYPDVVFLSDDSGRYKKWRQAVDGKRTRSGRGIPDLIVFASRWGYSGLCMELKADGVNPFTKTGSPKNPHIAEQKAVLEWLEKENYWAGFVVGFDRAKEVIDWYLGENPAPTPI